MLNIFGIIVAKPDEKLTQEDKKKHLVGVSPTIYRLFQENLELRAGGRSKKTQGQKKLTLHRCASND